ncbi:MAG: hypothetical protein HND52_17715 [Ignavibacteriae bacterium]|nr:hypothetical protein [Ignavibacteriota bacterium]NOG99801.1 hypothetical protein [Ignavibacteriota bacterium]
MIKQKAIRNLTLIVLCLLLIGGSAIAQGKWTASTSLQMNSGNYFFDTHMQTYYLYGGLGYQTDDWGLSAIIPVIASDGGSVSQFGNTFIPTQNEMHHSNEDPLNDSHRGMMGTGFLSDKEISIGDLYLNGRYNLMNQLNSNIDLYFNSYVKVPFADKNSGLGTGKFDYSLAMGVRKNIESFMFFAELGYLFLGDAPEINYIDPIAYNVGVGTFFTNQIFGLLLSYSGYSKVIDGYDPPAQVSLEIMLNSSHMMGYNIYASKGLSELNPDYTISGGMHFNF